LRGRAIGCQRRIAYPVASGHRAHQRLDSLADGRAVGFLLEIRLHDFPANAPGRGIGNDAFQAISGLDPNTPSARLAVLSGHNQQDQAGISARITGVSLGAYLPSPANRQGNLCFFTLAYCRQGHDYHLGPSGGPEPLNQSLQRILGGRVEQPGKVVDVADGLSRDERV
jgi:hypothetical protein